MAASTYDFIDDNAFEQGATLARRFIWQDSAGVPVNLLGYTARMQVRKNVIDPTVLLSLTTENAGIVLGGSAGTIDLAATATQMAALTWRTGVYDLELIAADGTVTRLLSGSVEMSPEVTRG